MRNNFKNGLRDEEVQIRQEKYGKNKLDDKKKESLIIKFLMQFNDFMIIILIAASIISAIMAKLEGTGDYLESIIIIVIVVFNAIMGLIQENKAEKSLEALKKMSAPVAKVIRNGREKIIDGEDVTIGDIVILEQGNFVPADCELIESYNLKTDESALTGETIPVLKEVAEMAYATTIVTSRTCKSSCN